MVYIDTIYDRYGTPNLKVLNNGDLVDFNGNFLGFIKKKNVYNYIGLHVGWYEEGTLRDHVGNVVGFGERPTDHITPILPITGVSPVVPIPRVVPLKPITPLSPIRPMKSFSWSEYSPITLLQN